MTGGSEALMLRTRNLCTVVDIMYVGASPRFGGRCEHLHFSVIYSYDFILHTQTLYTIHYCQKRTDSSFSQLFGNAAPPKTTNLVDLQECYTGNPYRKSPYGIHISNPYREYPRLCRERRESPTVSNKCWRQTTTTCQKPSCHKGKSIFEMSAQLSASNAFYCIY